MDRGSPTLTARVHIDAPVPAATALGRGGALAEAIGAEHPVLLYAAPLRDAALVLGQYQHAPHALALEPLEALALPVLRRASGGAAVWAGEGVLYFALGLQQASALMPCPPGRILNRNVRGLLAGVRTLGVPAHYFGRDFVSFATRPGAYLAWDEREDGRVLLECFVALETPFVLPEGLLGYPEPSTPAWRGKAPITLREAGARTASAERVLECLVEGYARTHGLSLEQAPPTAGEHARASELARQAGVDPEDTLGLCWSAPHEEAIGFLSAGVRLDPRGRFERVRIGGDLYQRRACPAELEARLRGHEPSADAVGAALDAVYGAAPGSIEGVRSLTSIRAALLDAATVAAR